MSETPERLWTMGHGRYAYDEPHEREGVQATEYIRADRAALSSAAVAEREPVATVAEVFVDGKRLYNITYPADALDKLPKGAALYIDPPPVSELEAEIARLKRLCAGLHDEVQFMREKAISNARERNAAEARLAEALKALEPFAEIAGEAWADGSGWTNAACQNDRICDWFGPSAFHTARRVREGGNVE